MHSKCSCQAAACIRSFPPSYLQAAAILLACILFVHSSISATLAQPAMGPDFSYNDVNTLSAMLPAAYAPSPAATELPGRPPALSPIAGGGASVMFPMSTDIDAPGTAAPEAAPAAFQSLAPSPDPNELAVYHVPCQPDYAPPRTPDREARFCDANYSVGIEFDASSGCIREKWANYYTENQVLDNVEIKNNTQSAQECCNYCTQTQAQTQPSIDKFGFNKDDRQCNMWTWCGEPTGCCKSRDGCKQGDVLNDENMVRYQTCTLKFLHGYSINKAWNATGAPRWYSASDVLNWPLWNTTSGELVTSACKTFTSGVALRWMSDPQPTLSEGLVGLPGVDSPHFDYGCSPKSHPEKFSNESKYEVCYIHGKINATSPACVDDNSCSGLVQLDKEFNQKAKLANWAYLKNFPDATSIDFWNPSQEQYPDCVSVHGYAVTYLFTNHSAPPGPGEPPAPPSPAPPPPPPLPAPAPAPVPVQTTTATAAPTIANAGAIAGGAVGGAAVLVASAVALACFLRKRKRTTMRMTVSEQLQLHNDQHQWPSDSLHRAVPGEAALSHQMLPFRSSTPAGKSASIRSPRGYVAQWSGSRGQKAPMLTGSSDESWLEMSNSAMQRQYPYAASNMLHSMAQGQERGEWGISPEELEIVKDDSGNDFVLGAGAFGVVYKALRGGVDAVAVKLIKGHQNVRAQIEFLREIELLKIARHPNVVLYLGACISDGKTLLVTEFMAGGDLLSRLSHEDHAFSWYNRGRVVALDVAQGLFYLHSHSVLHLDVKSGNVLLSRDGTAKISDVGLARVMRNSQYTRPAAKGTWAWAAPEVFLGEQCTIKADVFSYGVLLWEIVTMERPKRGNMRKIRVPGETSQEMDRLIQRCMQPYPQDRPDMREIIAILSTD